MVLVQVSRAHQWNDEYYAHEVLSTKSVFILTDQRCVLLQVSYHSYHVVTIPHTQLPYLTRSNHSYHSYHVVIIVTIVTIVTIPHTQLA